MGTHNAIVILYDGDLLSDKDVAKIAAIVGGQDICINVLSSEDLSKCIAEFVQNMTCKSRTCEPAPVMSESLRQSLIFIGEKYKNELHHRSIFVDQLACDLFEANRKISLYGWESDRTKDSVALITAVKEIAKIKYTDIPESWWKDMHITQEIYNHIDHFSEMCYV